MGQAGVDCPGIDGGEIEKQGIFKYSMNTHPVLINATSSAIVYSDLASTLSSGCLGRSLKISVNLLS